MLTTLQNLLTKIPHWVFLLVMAFGGGAVSYLTQVPYSNLFTDITTEAGIIAILKGAAVAGFLSVVALLKPASAGEVRVVQTARAAAKAAAILLVLGFTQAACISSAPIVPVTQQNQAAVSSCQSIASTHNDLVLGGFVFSGSGAALGTIAAIDQTPGDRTGFAIAGAGVAALAVIDTAWMALTSSEFAGGQCAALVGPLPLGKPASP